MSKVYLVGAGPGDPDLITVKGLQLLQHADCVLYDNLAAHALIDFAPPHAEKLYVGKKKSDHAFTQDEICAMLIDRGRRGLSVVRLKGGDPLIFGRGGEEAEALADAGLDFEIVPGVTSPLGVAAYAGIPLTHREHTSVVTFVSGHEVARIDWEKVGAAETLVILMGLTTFPSIATALIANGRAPETPAAAVRWGTRPDQEVVTGTLATLPGLIASADLKPPATIIVGDVVLLAGKLGWYRRLPLFGQTVVTTRAAHQTAALTRHLHAFGARTIELPTIEIQPPADPAALDSAIAHLPEYDWLVFTSANGVEHFLEHLRRSPLDLRAIRGRLCAIGPGTRASLEALLLKVDLMGREYVAESLLEAFAPVDVSGRRILLARAAVARDVLPAELARRGAIVDVVEAYRTVRPSDLADRAREAFGRKPRPDWITFTSSSTVENLMSVIGPRDLAGVKTATIGPVTSETARRFGIEVSVEASSYTVEGLVQAMVAGIIKT